MVAAAFAFLYAPIVALVVYSFFSIPRVTVWQGFSTFFFFQADDGIRDGHVTGVQTCALPISLSCLCRRPSIVRPCCVHSASLRDDMKRAASCATRSEERRVGKECRSRWS